MLGSFAIVNFAFFGLWETTLAVGAAAASIPIIIHLLNRRRYQVVTWAAMRFLLNAQKKTTKRMRLEQLLLLAVRTLLVILIVLSMASVMPWAETVWANIFPDGAGFLTKRTTRNHKILVLDGSLSMNVQLDEKRTAFERGQDLAAGVVGQAQAGDGFHVLLLNDSCDWLGQELSNDPVQTANEIRAARASHGNGNSILALKKIADKLEQVARESPQYKVHEVYFVTDLQRATWLMGAGKNDEVKKHLKQIQKYAQTVFVDVGKKDPNNLAVTDLSLSKSLLMPGDTVEVVAQVQHFGVVLRKQLPVRLKIGRGRARAEDGPFEMLDARELLIELTPGERKEVRFPYQFAKPGTYAVQVALGEDDMRPDNSRSTVVTVKETIPVLLINGKPAPEWTENATDLLSEAIHPKGKGPALKFNPFRPEVIESTELGNLSEVKLAKYDCIFLCDAAHITPGQVQRLENHLKRAGGLVVSMGTEAASGLKSYNELLFKEGKGILPGRLMGTVQAPKDHYFGPKASADAWNAPPLKAFADDLFKTSLLAVRFERFVQVAPAVGASTLLSLVLKAQPGAKSASGEWQGPVESPLLIGWNPPLPIARTPEADQKPAVGPMHYPGKVILMASTWNVDWTSWPGSPSYLPMVQELARVAVSGKVRDKAYVVGQPLQQYLIGGGTRLKVELHLPDPNEVARSLHTEGEGEITLFQWPLTGQAGVYRMIVGHDAHDYLFAVNPPVEDPVSGISESDLSPVHPDELKKLDADWQFQVVGELAKIRLQPQGSDHDEEWTEGRLGPGIAHTLLLGVLGLLILEVILAWAFGHFSSVPGATTQPARIHPLWPVASALAAGVAFVALATVLIHAAVTGDFLGFLPDAFRSWVEGSLDIPAPAAGEGTKWDLEFTSYFVDGATDPWLAAAITMGLVALLFFTYRQEGPQVHSGYKFVLGGLRLFVVLMVLAVLLPQLKLSFKRQGWPHVILLIDDSLSMGETDQYQDPMVQARVAELAEAIRGNLRKQLPDIIKQYQEQLQAKQSEVNGAVPDKVQDEIKTLQRKLKKLETQLAQLNSGNFNPNRLQLAQALLKNTDQDWVQYLLQSREMKVHVYHLDAVGKALALRDEQGNLLKLTEAGHSAKVATIHEAIAELAPHAQDSQLGTAVRQILDQFRGSSVSAVILLTDGITTTAANFTEYDRDLEKVSEYAEMKGVPLYLVGIGDDHELRDLKLHDLVAPDSVYVNDWIIFQAQLTGKGYHKLNVPVVLKIREKDGTETEVARIKSQDVDASGAPVPIELKYQAKTKGKKLFQLEVIPPEADNNNQPVNHSNLKLTRMVDVKDPEETIDVLYVEGGPRYEYRYIKTLLERESKDKKGKQSINLKVFLLDGDDDFHTTDDTALPEFPFSAKQLSEYEVIIFGDVNPKSPKMGEQKLKAVADFVRDHGGGLLMIAGANHNPHSYKNTPLADVMPIEVGHAAPKEPANWTEGYQVELSPVGGFHPIFRFESNAASNQAILQKLAPMYWHAQGFALKPLAEVLAFHPDPKKKTPLAVQQFVGAGRSMFFGFDETWRWRFRNDEPRFNQFWIQTVRYLSKKRVSETTLRLDRQMPYQVGDKIKVTVTFPDNLPPPKQGVKVLVQYTPPAKIGGDKTETTMDLAKVEGSWATFEGSFPATKEGKYHFRLISPLPTVPDGTKSDKSSEEDPPSAEAEVIQPPGELERLRMNKEGMEKAAQVSGGRFYTLATAHELPRDLPSGYRIVLNTEGPPHLLWNHSLCFALLIALLTAEWLLRKRKHLL